MSMTDSPAGLLVVFVYVGAVVLSLPAAATALLLARRVGVRRAAMAVSIVVLAVVGMAALTVAVLAGLVAGAWLAGLGIGALALLWALPARVGALLVRRATGLDDDAALGYAVAGLPAGMLGSAVWFVAPGGPARYNLTFLSGPALWLASAGFLATVLFGPGLAGTALYRLVQRGR